jgi:hypothetical protein
MLTQGGGHVVNISISLIEHANSMVPSALVSRAVDSFPNLDGVVFGW